MTRSGSLMRAGLAALMGSSLLLAACTEKPQTAGGKKSDAKAYAGTGEAAFTAPGWKVGDQASWEQQIKARNQAQNEYARAR
jgi:ABC-type glycerol-3-phosphate transport system substrate-binding protein